MHPCMQKTANLVVGLLKIDNVLRSKRRLLRGRNFSRINGKNREGYFVGRPRSKTDDSDSRLTIDLEMANEHGETAVVTEGRLRGQAVTAGIFSVWYWPEKDIWAGSARIAGPKALGRYVTPRERRIVRCVAGKLGLSSRWRKISEKDALVKIALLITLIYHADREIRGIKRGRK